MGHKALIALLVIDACLKFARTSVSCDFNTNALKRTRGPKWFQTFWEPCISCCNETRVGRMGDGGKWVCCDNSINQDTVIVSVGSNNDFSFELALLEDFDVKSVQVYDHTSRPLSNPHIHFHKKKMYRDLLEEILDYMIHQNKQLGILKVDCEGCEKDLFTDSVLNKLCRMNAQVLLEVHWRIIGQTEMAQLWNRFQNAGFGPFHKEPNIQWSDGSCVEYALMRRPNFVCK